jgi:endonuclease-3
MAKVLKKHYKPVKPLEDRDLLSQMLYACILEYAHFDKADAAYQRVRQLSFDLNEIRVTTVAELAESLAGAVNPRLAAWNLKRLLHSVFEQQYAFDLDYMKKQNLGKTQSDLARHPGATPFVVSYVTQHALGGHSLPLNKSAFDVLYIAGVIDESERDNQVAPGLERAIPKKQGIEFGSLLHQMAIDLMASPFNPKNRAVLSEMHATAKDRLPRRPAKKKPAPAATEKKPDKTPAKGASNVNNKKSVPEAKAKKTPKKVSPPKAPPPKKPARKKAVTGHNSIQTLSRRKPR